MALLNPLRYLRTPSGEFRKATCSSCEALEQLICSSHTTLEKQLNAKARGFQKIWNFLNLLARRNITNFDLYTLNYLWTSEWEHLFCFFKTKIIFNNLYLVKVGNCHDIHMSYILWKDEKRAKKLTLEAGGGKCPGPGLWPPAGPPFTRFLGSLGGFLEPCPAAKPRPSRNHTRKTFTLETVSVRKYGFLPRFRRDFANKFITDLIKYPNIHVHKDYFFYINWKLVQQILL